jgi:O-antigen ligase
MKKTSHQLPFLSWTVVHIALVLVGLVAVAPMVQPVHVLPLTSFYSQWLAFALGMAAGIVLLTRDFWKKLSIPVTSVYLLGFITLIALQSLVINHVYVTQPLVPALYFCWAALLAIVAYWLRTQIGADRVVAAFAWFVLLGGVLHALVGLAQYVDYGGYLEGVIVYNPGATFGGNLAQPNHYATQLTLAAIALSYLYAVGRLSPYLAGFLLLLLVFVLALTGSRSVVLYSTAILFFSALSYWKSRTTIHLRFSAMAACLLVLFLLAQYLLPPFAEWLQTTLIELGFRTSEHELLTAMERLRGSEGIVLRTSEWHKAWLMFLQSPLWGVGVGHYGWFSFNYQVLPQFAAITKPSLFTHAHNVFAQVTAELGIAGLLLLLGLLYGWIKQYLRNWQAPANWFIGACLLVLFIHSNLEHPLWFAYFLGICAFLLGLGDQRSIKLTFTPWLGQVTAALVLIICAAILAITFVGYQAIANANLLILHSSPAAAAQTMRTVSRNVLLTPLAEEIMATHGILDKKLIAKQLELTTRVMDYHPNPIKVQRQIVYLAFAGKTTEAIALLDTAAAAYPTHMPSYVCDWQKMTAAEMQPITKHAKQLMGAQPTCDNDNSAQLEQRRFEARLHQP